MPVADPSVLRGRRPGPRLLLGLLLLAWPALAAAMPPDPSQFRRFGIVDGLPTNFVFMVAQDRAGYLWIATSDGLVRHDGVGFEVWQHDPERVDSLPSNMVQMVFVDPQDRVWVGMEGGGVAVMGPERRGFQRYWRQTHAEIGSDEVYAIASDAEGNVWFGGYLGGLHRIDADGGVRRFLPVEGDDSSLPAEIITSLVLDGAGQLWVGTVGGLARWTGRAFERVPAASLSGRAVMSLAARQDGSLVVGTHHGVDLLEPGGAGRPLLDSAGETMPAPVLAIVDDRHGGRWFATPRGLVREEAGRVERLSIDRAEQLMVNHVFEDREGGIWVATRESGLFHLPARWRDFSVLRRIEGRPDSPSMQVPRGLGRSADGRVWMVGDQGMLDRVDPASRRIERHALPEAIGRRRLLSVLETREGRVWLGGANVLARIDPGGGRSEVFRITDVPDLQQGAMANMLLEDAAGRIWVSTLGSGVQLRDRDGGLLRELLPGGDGGLQPGDNGHLIVGIDGEPWLAGGQGLLRWRPQDGRFEPVPGTPRQRIFAVAREGEGLWIHHLRGLEHYLWRDGALVLERRVGTREGLPAVESGGLVITPQREVWLSTLRGLLRYRPADGTLRVFGSLDGLPTDTPTSDPILLADSGELMVPLAGALLMLKPSAMEQDARQAPLQLHRISLRRGEQVLVHDPAEPLRLGPGDRDLQVAARLLSFVNPSSHRYQFLLHGQDPDWIDVGKGERVFSRLPAGRYVLDVRAAPAAGAWSAPAGLVFEVEPPLWATPLALLAYVLLALALLAWAAQAYRQRLRRRHAFQLAEQRRRLAEEASEAKSRFLATLGHEVRTPMTGVLGMAELLSGTPLDPRQRGYVNAIRQAGEHLVRLVNDALDLARIEAGRLELRPAAFDLQALIGDVCGLLAPLAERKGLAFRCDIAEGCPRGVVGDADRVRQILLNLGSNAIKFTEAGSVVVAAAAQPGQGVVVTVADTGPGLNAEQQGRLFRRFEQAEGERTRARHGGSGLGLAISQELAAAMGGQIAVRSRAGEGSVFTVSLPLPAAQGPVPMPGAAKPVAVAARGWQVLLVEDDLTVAQVMIGLLEAQGHHPTHVPHGLAALAELEQGRHDIALLDLDLPGVDGIELARLIRTQHPDLPLMAVTARADPDAEPAARAAGMDGFLRKPVTGALLAEAMDAARRQRGG